MQRMIRVNHVTYSKLAETAGKLQARLRRRVSLSDALDYLLHKTGKRARQFWSKLKEKRARKLLGRGPVRTPVLGTTLSQPPGVHTSMNSRREVS